MAEPTIDREADVPEYELPEIWPPTEMDWSTRRAELIALAEQHIYGRLPSGRAKVTATLVDDGPLQGLPSARRRQWRVAISAGPATAHVDLLLVSPATLPGNRRPPVVLALNFYGNHTVTDDPTVVLPRSWVPARRELAARDHRASAADRGLRVHRFPLELILSRGAALATAYCGDIAPDTADAPPDAGVWPVLRALGFAHDAPDRPGTIAAWAWGLSRLLDALRGAAPELNEDRVAVLGHSRLGKAALWAGVLDPRFWFVAVNESGCGGAALARRRFGERLVNINTNFPHWFCPRHHTYNEREADLPLDQHQVLAAVAPRSLHVGSAAEDRWADPKGEYLALREAATVWRRLGAGDFPLEPGWPESGGVVRGASLAYHLRPGPHNLTAVDWEHYLDSFLPKP